MDIRLNNSNDGNNKYEVSKDTGEKYEVLEETGGKFEVINDKGDKCDVTDEFGDKSELNKLEEKESELNELNKQLLKWRNRANGWLIVSIGCAISIIMMTVTAYNNFDRVKYYRTNYCNSISEIEELKSQLPQSYYTKYPKQHFYSFNNEAFEKTCWYITEEGTKVTIFLKAALDANSTVYGLTQWGYIPMDSLEQR